jgi:hypothetical protein
MRRPTRLLAALVTVGAFTVPTGSASAACTEDVPTVDKRAAVVTCTGVFPGMNIKMTSMKFGPDHLCGASFVFVDQYKQKYLVFPGSCYLDYSCLEDAVYNELPPPLNELVPRVPVCLMPGDSELEPVYKRKGPPVTDYDGRRIGSIVYAVNKDGIDFALARLDPGVKVDPAMPVWGGPRRMGGAAGSLEEAYVFSEQGLPAPNARSGYLQVTGGDVTWIGDGLLSISTGSPVMKPNGDAVGMILGRITIPTGFEVQTFGAAIDRLRTRTGLRLKLMAAPLKK